MVTIYFSLLTNILHCFQDGRIDYSEFAAMMQDTDFGKMGLQIAWVKLWMPSSIRVMPNEDLIDNFQLASSLPDARLCKCMLLQIVWALGRGSMNGLLIIGFMYLQISFFLI